MSLTILLEFGGFHFLQQDSNEKKEGGVFFIDYPATTKGKRCFEKKKNTPRQNPSVLCVCAQIFSIQLNQKAKE